MCVSIAVRRLLPKKLIYYLKTCLFSRPIFSTLTSDNLSDPLTDRIVRIQSLFRLLPRYTFQQSFILECQCCKYVHTLIIDNIHQRGLDEIPSQSYLRDDGLSRAPLSQLDIRIIFYRHFMSKSTTHSATRKRGRRSISASGSIENFNSSSASGMTTRSRQRQSCNVSDCHH